MGWMIQGSEEQGSGGQLRRVLEFIGSLWLFGFRVITNAIRAPFELEQVWRHIGEMGVGSLPLVAASGLALGVVMTLHTRSMLVAFGAAASIPRLQSLSFFVEIGPLLAALLVSGRVGAGIGAVVANMRASEQIDAIEAFSVDSFKFLVVPRVVACIIVLPLLTLFMDFCGVGAGFLSEYAVSHISLKLYIERAFSQFGCANLIPPILKTTVFGFLIGTVSSYFGYTINDGAEGVGRAATNSVVLSSLLVIVADVALVKIIFLIFPEGAI